ncbi:rhodanese-like domain-containing protein [Moraxella haemolytica]|uniref:rhodanese-like domain-containing protein n=1 Tax=Moraxella TaxID=475 RepID=UPI002542B5FF|nr:rhodanese-like domain-containing protein [Moraxella sp. ZY171148]WII95249.1 rhodanese-like domain-containing protein [Moraxella sp. ZY171148]
MKIKYLAIIATAIALSACGDKTAESRPTTIANQSDDMVVQTPKKADGIWIDVRSAEEYNQGHLQDAVNVTPNEIAQKIASLEPNKDAPINLYCRSGRRAEAARTILIELGYTNVTNHGGYDDLVEQGLK